MSRRRRSWKRIAGGAGAGILGTAGLVGLGKLGYDEWKARQLLPPEPLPVPKPHNPTLGNRVRNVTAWVGGKAADAAGALGGAAQEIGKDFAKWQTQVNPSDVVEVPTPKPKPASSMFSSIGSVLGIGTRTSGNDEVTSARRPTPQTTAPTQPAARNLLMQNRRGEIVSRGVRHPKGLPEPMTDPGIRNAKGRMVVTPFETVGKKSAMPGYTWALPETAYKPDRIGATVGQDGRSIFRKFRATTHAEPVLQRLNSGLARQHFANNPRKPLPDQFWTPYTGKLKYV